MTENSETALRHVIFALEKERDTLILQLKGMRARMAAKGLQPAVAEIDAIFDWLPYDVDEEDPDDA